MTIYNVIYAQNFQNRSRIRSKTLYMLNFSTKIFEIFEKRYICPTLYMLIHPCSPSHSEQREARTYSEQRNYVVMNLLVYAPGQNNKLI